MPKKSIWDSSLAKALGVLATLLAILAFFFQFGRDIWTPLSNFLPSEISIYVFLVTVAVFVVLIYVLVRVRRLGKTKGDKSNILDLSDARTIAILCQKPQTTGFLRTQYENMQRSRNVVVIGGYGFNDYIERLEKEGYLIYRQNKWQVTQEAMDYIAKYHGGN